MRYFNSIILQTAKCLIALLFVCLVYKSYAQTEESTQNIIFKLDNLGRGYSSPFVSQNAIYVTGERDSIGFLSAFDLKGNILWEKNYGQEWTGKYPGTRAVPVENGSMVYVCSGMGSIYCFHKESGNILWETSQLKDLNGKSPIWGYSMPVVIENDILICFPGGVENNIVALNKDTGELIWASKGVGETAGYAPAITVKQGELTILLLFSEFTFMGINMANGELLWTFNLNFKGELPCNKPVFNEGIIYIVAGPGNGCTALKLSDDGRSIKELWNNMDFNSAFGNFEKVGHFLFGSADHKNSFMTINTKNGKTESRLKFGRGACIKADNFLIAYNRRGEVGIIQNREGKLSLLYDFKITMGIGEHFTIPVYSAGVLYIRRGENLTAFRLDNIIS